MTVTMIMISSAPLFVGWIHWFVRVDQGGEFWRNVSLALLTSGFAFAAVPLQAQSSTPSLAGIPIPQLNLNLPFNIRMQDIVSRFPPQLDSRLGVLLAAEVPALTPSLPDEPSQAFINKMGARLVGVMGSKTPKFNYSFIILQKAAPNAYALPGGPVYVNTGLIAKMENEAQLAGIVAHMMGHIAERHILTSMFKKMGQKFVTLTAPANLDPAILKDWASQAVGIGDDKIGIRYFPPEIDKDADVFAVQLMARAGYDPAELVKVFEKLIVWQKELNAEKKNRQIGFLRDHHDKGRIQVIQTQIAALKLKSGQVSPGSTLSDQIRLK
jgi:predicted Zn-dependent protease